MQPLRIEAKFARPLNFADFDKKSMRKGFTQVGRDVSKIAKKLVSKKGVSAAGAYPGKQTGIFQKAISYKVSRSGFSVALDRALTSFSTSRPAAADRSAATS